MRRTKVLVNGKVGREEAKKDHLSALSPRHPRELAGGNRSKFAAEGAMEHGLEERVKALSAGGLFGFQLADYRCRRATVDL